LYSPDEAGNGTETKVETANAVLVEGTLAGGAGESLDDTLLGTGRKGVEVGEAEVWADLALEVERRGNVLRRALGDEAGGRVVGEALGTDTLLVEGAGALVLHDLVDDTGERAAGQLAQATVSEVPDGGYSLLCKDGAEGGRERGEEEREELHGNVGGGYDK